MKRLLWIGLLFLSVSWLFFIPIFVPPDLKQGLIFLIIGIVCNIFAFWKTKTFKVNRKYFLFLIPLLASLFIISFPYNLGITILIIGGITYFLLVHLLKYKKLGWVSLGLSFSGLILTIQTAIIPFYFILASHYHRVDFFSPLVSFFGRLFGLHTSVNNGIVFVQTVAQTHPFTTTLEKLGFFPWIMIFIGALAIFFFSPKIKDAGKKIFLFLILSGIYLVLRYLFLIFVFTTIAPGNLDMFWDATYIFISFLPFVLLLACFIPLKKLAIDLRCFKKLAIDKKRVLAMVMIFIFVFSIIGAYAYQDPGIEKKGRILVDELHNDWEDSSRKMGKEWYGKISTYNAYCLVEWLDYYYDVDRNMNDTLSSALLSDYDVLVIFCPTSSFSDEEIDTIVAFVEDGGGLYLVGDHTNVFGMNFYLNQISERFDIIFRYDSTHDLKTKKLSIYESPKLFAHPIVQFTPTFNYLSSCTLDVPITSENVMIGYGLTSAMGTYSTEHFFRYSAYTEPDVEQGLFVQTVALKYGKGRVVAFTDSTCISNFCIFMDGYPSTNLMTMEYLNRSNLYSYVNDIFVAIGVIFLVLISYLLWKEKKAMIVFMLIVIGLLSFSVATPLFSYMNSVNYSLPESHTDFTKVCFVEDHSDFVISSRTASMSVSWNKVFNNFFIWTQRVDFVPSVEETLGDALEKGDAVVFINPVQSFGRKEARDIKEYMENGGNVLLMDGISNANSTANELLYYFDVQIVTQKEVNSTAYSLSISGSNTTFFVENNHTSITMTNIGKGKLVVVVDSNTFSNSVMGGAFTVPTSYQLEVYNVEFDLFEKVLFEG